MARKQNIVWIDVETTGIDANHEKLLQVALRVTDHDLNFIDGDGFERKVYYSEDEVAKIKERAVPFVQEMHEKTGLWDALSTEGIPMGVLEVDIMAHLVEHVPEAKTARLAGNSITLDRNFINANLPVLGNHLHYRSYDVTTIAGMVEMYVGGGKMYRKDSTHEAMDDITESVNEFRHYKELLFPLYSGLTEDEDSSQ